MMLLDCTPRHPRMIVEIGAERKMQKLEQMAFLLLLQLLLLMWGRPACWQMMMTCVAVAVDGSDLFVAASMLASLLPLLLKLVISPHLRPNLP